MDYQSQINALEARIRALEEPNFFSDKFIELLIQTGFLKLDSRISYESQLQRIYYMLFVRAIDDVYVISATPNEYIQPFTVNVTTNVINSNLNGLSDDQQVTLTSTGSLPSPLLTGQFYYVIDATANSFKLSLTAGGSAIDITDTGVGVHYWEYIT